MVELLVPAEKAHFDQVSGNNQPHDLEIRPRLMVAAIEQLQDAHGEPDVWKIEGLERHDACHKLVAAARRGSRKKVGCIVLGRGEDDKKVREWVTSAAGVPRFIRSAVGRTVFWDPPACVAKRTTKDATVAEICRRYLQFVDLFERGSGFQTARGS